MIKLRKSAAVDSDAEAPAAEALTQGRDKRLLAVAGGVGALVVAGGAFFLLHGGSGDGSTAASGAVPRSVKAATPAAAAPAATTPAAAPGVVPPPAKTPTGKNPFKALIVPAGTAAGGDSSTGSTTTATPTTTPTTGTTTTSYTPYDLTVNSLSPATDENRTASVTYGGKTVSVYKNQTFGTYGELVLLGFTGDTGIIVQAGDGAPQALTVGSKTTVA